MELTEQVGAIAREAGILVRDLKNKKDLRIDEKGSSFDFVTEADLSSQKLIRERVAQLFPEDRFIGEEDGLPDEEVNRILMTNPEGHRIWVADPLDGTLNYIRNMLGYGVSVAVLTGPRVTNAAIYQPDGDALYTAEIGAGAFCNGVPICTAEHTELCDAMAATGVPVSDMEWRAHTMLWMQALSAEALNVRMLGAAVYNQTRVADGGLDYYLEIGPHAWDLAAGKLIIEEAGGIVTRLDGGEFDFGWGGVLAASKSIYDEVLELLRSSDPGISYLRR